MAQQGQNLHKNRDLDAPSIVRSMHAATEQWHQLPEMVEAPSEPLSGLVLLLHKANFDLWHEEDKARDPHAPDATIAQVKRNIDRFNQHRNDTVERLDLMLLELAGDQNPSAQLHSETPGLILDRLSILALKIFHTAEQAGRDDADADHITRNRQRLQILESQAADLTQCLSELWSQVLAGTRRFKLYRQLKMYNDPTLNPVMYRGGTPPSVR